MPKSSWAPPKASRGKCERRRGSANADGAGAEAFAGDEHSRERLFCPMALISRLWLGGRIYNNTRTREPLRRKCVKPAALTTHSPPKICSRPPTATRPPSRRRRTPADPTTHSPPKTVTRSRTATRPSRTLSHPLSLPSCHIPAAPTHTRRLRDTFLVEDLLPSPSVPLRAQKNGTAQWMCDAECLDRPSLRSVIGVGEPRAVRRRCGALAWRVGLRPQPWALRSRRCGRVLRA